MANPLLETGAEGGFYGLQQKAAADASKPAWMTAPTFSPAAYGSVPSPVAPPSTTAPQNTSTAIATGTQVYSQLPGYQQDLATAGSNISSDLAGEVPAGTQAELAQAAAERGVSTGGGGNAGYLKALGLESLGLGQSGLQEFESLLPTLPGAQVSQNPGFYVTPGQGYDAAVQNSVWGSAPIPASAAQAAYQTTQAGFNSGAGSVAPAGGYRPTPSALPAGIVQPSPASVEASSPQPSSLSIADTGYAPGSPGAIANWNDWYSSIIGGGSSGDDSTPNPDPQGGMDY